MASGLAAEDIISLIKNKLNGERVKLWLPPYTEDDGSQAPFTLELIKRYAGELNLKHAEVEEAVEHLRQLSLERLSARDSFQLTGVATLKVKLTIDRWNKKTLTIETKLDIKGLELRNMIAKKCEVEADRLKLISAGRLITDEKSLEEQEISVMSPVMALVLPKPHQVVPDESQPSTSLQRTRDDAEILANMTEADYLESHMQIADQNGRILDIPKHHRKALAVAMVLNEKGKTELRKKQYSQALHFLLEADKEFKKCSADILNVVDNYGLLCLDISWCYLCLKSIEDLPDAEARLKTSEECIKKSYGDNLERLLAVKGTTGSESALLVRLHLLKGIVAYCRRQWKVAEELFNKVDTELRQLKVDDEKLTQVMAVGFTPAQARLSLRSCSGDVEMAVSYLLNKAKEKEEEMKKEREERIKRKAARKLGKTVNGEWVNLEFHNMLLSMGYPSMAATQALSQSNNNVSLAVQIIQENPDLLTLPDFSGNNVPVTEEMIAQLCSCGFDLEAAQKCLQKHNGNVEAAVVDLVSTGGIFLEEQDEETEKSTKQMQEEALERLRSDIPEDEDAHLDLTLEDEGAILDEYRILLQYAQR